MEKNNGSSTNNDNTHSNPQKDRIGKDPQDSKQDNLKNPKTGPNSADTNSE